MPSASLDDHGRWKLWFRGGKHTRNLELHGVFTVVISVDYYTFLVVSVESFSSSPLFPPFLVCVSFLSPGEGLRVFVSGVLAGSREIAKSLIT